MRNLNPSHARFAEEYIKDLDGTAAAIRAGYKESGARYRASKLLAREDVQQAIAEALKARTERTQVDADYVLNRLVEIDKMDVIDILADDGNLKPVRDWPPVWRQYISGMDVSEIFEGHGDERDVAGVLKKIKWPDKVKNLELIGKHVDVQAWRERQELTGPNGGPVETVTRVELVPATGNEDDA